MCVEKHKKTYTDFTPTEEMQQQIEEAAGDDMYTKMAQVPLHYGYTDGYIDGYTDVADGAGASSRNQPLRAV